MEKVIKQQNENNSRQGARQENTDYSWERMNTRINNLVQKKNVQKKTSSDQNINDKIMFNSADSDDEIMSNSADTDVD